VAWRLGERPLSPWKPPVVSSEVLFLLLTDSGQRHPKLQETQCNSILGRKVSKFRIAVPIALVATAVAITVFGPAIQRTDSDIAKQDVKSNDLVSPAPRREPVYDEDGRRVLLVGDISLHIPTSQNAISTNADGSGTVQVNLCWPREEDTGECPGIENVVVIFLTGGNEQPTVDDGMAKLRQELSIAEGPFDSEMEGIWEFRLPSSEARFYYAIVEPDPTGRHVTARCYGGPRCSSWISIVPGLAARYNFDKQHLPIWTEIDQQVRSYVRSFVIETAVD